MRTQVHSVVAIALSVCLSSISSRAQDFALVSQSRMVTVSTNGWQPLNPALTASAPDFGPFQTNLTLDTISASQTSTIGTDLMAASGSAVGGGRSTFNVTFDLASPTVVSLTGSLYSADPTNLGGPSVRLSQTGGVVHVNLYLSPAATNGVATPFSFSSELEPGRYILSAVTNLPVDDSSLDSFDLAFAVVPEPGTWLLVGFGLPVVFVVRRTHLFPA